MPLKPTTIDVTSVSEHTMCEMTAVGFMIDSLVGVVDSGVTAHGFEHYLLGDVEIGGKTFCHMRQRTSGYVLEGVGDAVNDALGISCVNVGHDVSFMSELDKVLWA